MEKLKQYINFILLVLLITMDNDLYGRYRGEVQITLNDLPADERVNVIGKVIPEDILLLSFIKPGQGIKLIGRK